MTSHQLAHELLKLPDLPVTQMEWCAGSDQWHEIADVSQLDGTRNDEEGEKFGQPHIHLS